MSADRITEWTDRGQVSLVADLAAKQKRVRKREIRQVNETVREELVAMTDKEREEWARVARDKIARANMPMVKGRTRTGTTFLRRRTSGTFDATGIVEESAMYQPKRHVLRHHVNNHRAGCRCPVCHRPWAWQDDV